MSTEKCLALRLTGPLQSWGCSTTFTHYRTHPFPTKSAVCGLCCAAAGIRRGSDLEADFIRGFNLLHMKAVAVMEAMEEAHENVETGDFFSAATASGIGSQGFAAGRKIEDFHTVSGTMQANGSANCRKIDTFYTVSATLKADKKNFRDEAVITRREYLVDARFFVFLTGSQEKIERLAEALKDPALGIFLGRKSCIPAEPVFAGVFDSLQQAEEASLQGFVTLMSEEDEAEYGRANVSVSDVAVSFLSERRAYSPRRVKRIYAG